MSSSSESVLSRFRPEAWMWLSAMMLMLCLWGLLLAGQFNLLCAALIFGTLLIVSFRDRATAALYTIFVLNILGDLRRVVASTFGQAPLDLLLLVGPLMAIVLALPAFLELRLKDRLSKAMLFLLVIMIVEILNPLQGGVSVGLSGAIFYIVPVLWFWVGRQFASPAVLKRLLYHVLFPLSVAAALLGLCQTFVGFLPWEQAWLDLVTRTYQALYVGRSVRAFGFSVSGAEYDALLAMGASGCAAAYFGSKRIWAIAAPLLTIAVILASERAVVIRLVMSFAVIWTLRNGGRFTFRKIAYSAVLVISSLVAIGVVASHLAPSEDASAGSSSAVQSLIAHQTGGFAHPLDSRYSTANLHRDMILAGLLQAVKTPVGHGLGSTTMAANKFGGDATVSSSEMDLSDICISVGLIGGLLYLYIVFAVLRRAMLYVQRVELAVSLPIIAILVSSLATWMIGGQYSTSAMVFFLIGGLVHAERPSTEVRKHSRAQPRLSEWAPA